MSQNASAAVTTVTGDNKKVDVVDTTSGQKVTLPVIDGSLGPSVIDIRKLYGETDRFTYDP